MKKPKRCKICRKRTLLNLECKCKNTYCMKHRLPESHKCSDLLEFKNESRALLKKTLKKIESSKLTKLENKYITDSSDSDTEDIDALIETSMQNIKNEPRKKKKRKN